MPVENQGPPTQDPFPGWKPLPWHQQLRDAITENFLVVTGSILYRLRERSTRRLQEEWNRRIYPQNYIPLTEELIRFTQRDTQPLTRKEEDNV